MGAARKLQNEIDKTLKKVIEGEESVDELFDKVASAESQNQRDKHETELKKEIKKLQRLRDHIKAWITDANIKDKTQLQNARRRIESRMERFKEIEKEGKAKLFDKDGISLAIKNDPHELAKQELHESLNTILDELNLQVDGYEAEIEQISATQKKKKAQDNIKKLNEMIRRHKEHVLRMEQIMRCLDNDLIEISQVESVIENLRVYKEDHKENFDTYSDPDEFYYDMIEELDSAQAGLNQAQQLIHAASPAQNNSKRALLVNELDIQLEPTPLVKEKPIVINNSSSISNNTINIGSHKLGSGNFNNPNVLSTKSSIDKNKDNELALSQNESAPITPISQKESVNQSNAFGMAHYINSNSNSNNNNGGHNLPSKAVVESKPAMEVDNQREKQKDIVPQKELSISKLDSEYQTPQTQVYSTPESIQTPQALPVQPHPMNINDKSSIQSATSTTDSQREYLQKMTKGWNQTINEEPKKPQPQAQQQQAQGGVWARRNTNVPTFQAPVSQANQPSVVPQQLPQVSNDQDQHFPSMASKLKGQFQPQTQTSNIQQQSPQVQQSIQQQPVLQQQQQVQQQPQKNNQQQQQQQMQQQQQQQQQQKEQQSSQQQVQPQQQQQQQQNQQQQQDQQQKNQDIQNAQLGAQQPQDDQTLRQQSQQIQSQQQYSLQQENEDKHKQNGQKQSQGDRNQQAHARFQPQVQQNNFLKEYFEECGAWDFSRLNTTDVMKEMQTLHQIGQQALPQIQDREWQRMPLHPKTTPYQISESFPRIKPKVLNDPALFDKLKLETLFYAFHYQPGSYQQLLSAKKLQQQSWSYHKQLGVWFQFTPQGQDETGNYNYWDPKFQMIENSRGWNQKVMKNFHMKVNELETGI